MPRWDKRTIKRDRRNLTRRRTQARTKAARLLVPIGRRTRLTNRGLEKQCTLCGLFKLVEPDFHKSGPGKFKSSCKDCYSRYISLSWRGRRKRTEEELERHRRACREHYQRRGNAGLQRLRRAEYRAQDKSLLNPKCADCQRMRRALKQVRELRAWATEYMTSRPESATFDLFCGQHDRYVMKQNEYAQHVAEHWARVVPGERRTGW